MTRRRGQKAVGRSDKRSGVVPPTVPKETCNLLRITAQSGLCREYVLSTPDFDEERWEAALDAVRAELRRQDICCPLLDHTAYSEHALLFLDEIDRRAAELSIVVLRRTFQNAKTFAALQLAMEMSNAEESESPNPSLHNYLGEWGVFVGASSLVGAFDSAETLVDLIVPLVRTECAERSSRQREAAFF
jgi:hypothetical protein